MASSCVIVWRTQHPSSRSCSSYSRSARNALYKIPKITLTASTPKINVIMAPHLL